MKSDLLLYVATGLYAGSMVLGVMVGLAYMLRAKVSEFKYGVFYSVFALVASTGYALAMIAFFFNFLGPKLQIPIFCSLIALGFIVGLVVMALFIKKDSRVLFAIMSLYLIFSVYLAPIFLWNIIYLVFVAKLRPPSDNPPLPTPLKTETPASATDSNAIK